MKTGTQILIFLLLILSISGFSQNKIDALILNKDYDQAFAEIDKHLSTNPSAELFLKKGMIFQKQQDYQGALQAYLQGINLEPNNILLVGEIAECFAILGNNSDAIAFYEKARKLEPDNLVFAGKLGRVHINQKNYKAGYEVFSFIYEKDSSNVFWNKQLAYCAFRIFNRKQAVDLYVKVLEMNPRDYGSYTNLIHCYNWKKHGNEIMQTIKKGLEQFPNDAGLILEQAMFFYKTKRYGPAMLQFEKYMAAEKEPTYEITMNYGISSYFAEFYEKSLEIFNGLRLLNPNDPLVMYYQSLCHKRMKNFEESEELMQWAIDASVPDYVAEMYHHLGQILGQQRKFKESIAALEKAYKLNGSKTELLFEIATTYEEYNSNKTLALNYYKIYLKEAGERAKNVNYALDRIDRLKEDLFFEE